MVKKATTKRAPPPRPKSTGRVWDKLEIALPARAIDRDIRLIEQRIAALARGSRDASVDSGYAMAGSEQLHAKSRSTSPPISSFGSPPPVVAHPVQQAAQGLPPKAPLSLPPAAAAAAAARALRPSHSSDTNYSGSLGLPPGAAGPAGVGVGAWAAYAHQHQLPAVNYAFA